MSNAWARQKKEVPLMVIKPHHLVLGCRVYSLLAILRIHFLQEQDALSEPSAEYPKY